MAVPEEILAARPWIAHYPAGVPAEIAPESRMSLGRPVAPQPVALWRPHGAGKFRRAPDLRAAGRGGRPGHGVAAGGRPRQGRPRRDHGAQCDGLSGDPDRRASGGRGGRQHQPALHRARTGVPDRRRLAALSVRAGKFRRDRRRRARTPEAGARRAGGARRPARRKGRRWSISSRAG